MNDQLRAYLDAQATAVEDEVRQALELTKGDAIQALRVTLIANAFLEAEVERLTAQCRRFCQPQGGTRLGETWKAEQA